MNGYVEAGYAVALGTLGAYSLWLLQRSVKLKRALIPIKVTDDEEANPKGQ